MNYANAPRRCEQFGFKRRDRLPCPADLLIEASGGRGYNPFAFKAAIGPKRVAIVNRKSTTQATIANRSGQAMVEFAIISFVLITILTGILGFGLMLLKANIGVVAVGSISNLLDREFTSVEIEKIEGSDDSAKLITALARLTRDATGQVYFSETDLVLEPERYRQALTDFEASGVSLVIKSLLPLYQWDDARERFHFPGTIVRRVSDDEFTVLVPLTNTRDDSNLYVISNWLRPVDFTYDPPEPPPSDPPSAPEGKPAKATVTINYPASSAVLIAYRDTGELTPNGDPVRSPISAEISPNSMEVSLAFGGEYTIDADGDTGIDSAYAYGTRVHIFQRVFTQSSTFRFREQSSTQPAVEPTP
jgi:hypothetical protein